MSKHDKYLSRLRGEQASRRSPNRALRYWVATGAMLISARCGLNEPPPGVDTPRFNNTTDPTNEGASYVGGDACRSCHAGIEGIAAGHGHSGVLTPVHGKAPEFPGASDGVGVPAPPEGFAWTDVSYVIGGHGRKANFLDLDGYLLTTGLTGTATQWNLGSPLTGASAGWAEYRPEASEPEPYSFACLRCHATGTVARTADSAAAQDNRPGIEGTWLEPSVQCEACHGPGSKHVPNPSARDIFVATGAAACVSCHSRDADSAEIAGRDGFVAEYQQSTELLASGGHASFTCLICHDPHRSLREDRAEGIRNECRACHVDDNMALHDGLVFVRADGREEPLSCESCHMPYAVRSATEAAEALVGPVTRHGDGRSHIFRLNTLAVDFTGMFTADGTSVVRDAKGRASVTLDFVCLRCHNGLGNAFNLSVDRASELATDFHDFAAGAAESGR